MRREVIYPQECFGCDGGEVVVAEGEVQKLFFNGVAIRSLFGLACGV
jgi:hypothetical protein